MTTKKKNKDVKLEKAWLLEKAYKLASIGHWELDLGNEELYWSAEVKNLHEVAPDYQPDVQTAIDFYPEGEYRMAIRNAVQEAIEHGKAYDLELKIITAKGNEKWIRTAGDSIRENGKCIKLYGSTQDISKRKKAEHSLQLQSISTNNLAEGVYLIRSSDGEIVYTNPTFDRMFGYEPGELVGKHVSVVNAPTDKSPEKIAEEINQNLGEKGTWSGEVYNLKKKWDFILVQG